MQKIGFFNSTKTWGGGEKWHYETAVYFAQRGYPVVFFGQEGSILQEKIRAHSTIRFVPLNVSNYSFLNPVKVSSLRQLFREMDISTLLINLSSDLKLAGQAASKAGVKRIIYRRGSAIPVRNSSFNQFIFKNWVTDILANSEATREAILRNNDQLFPASRIKVIYNPVDVNAFFAAPYEKLYNKAPGELVIATLGRLEAQKNQKFLLYLSAELQRREIAHKIIISGRGSLEKELKKLSHQLKVAEHVLFTGFVENVKNVLMSCDIFILPSLWEGFGYALAEASLSGKAIIAFDISSNPEVVQAGHSGFLIPPNDLNACADSIIRLKKAPGLCQKMGENGRAYVSEHFEKGKILQETESYVTGLAHHIVL